MLNQHEIMQTIQMIDQQHLDVRTITMGISLLSCAHSDDVGGCQGLGNGLDQLAVSFGHALLHQGGEAADEVHEIGRAHV